MSAERPVALVTGASRGLGRALALQCGARGMDVVLAARTVEPTDGRSGSLTETAEAVRAAGADAHVVACDLSRSDDVVALAEAALAWRGHVDVLANNAALLGRATYQRLDELSLVDWQRQLDVNLTAPFLLAQRLAPGLRRRGAGTVINITSAAAELREGTLPGMCYGASKAALSRFTLALARELRPAGVAAVAVDPGYVRTEIAERAAEESGMDISTAILPEHSAAAILSVLDRSWADVTGRVFKVVRPGELALCAPQPDQGTEA